MNCKQGDLAVIVRSIAGNEGKIVICVRPLPAGAEGRLDFGPRWVMDRTLLGTGGPMSSAPDAFLRPLRDTDGEDEMRRIVGVPATAAARLKTV